MAKNDIKVVESPFGALPTYRWQVASGAAASIKAGEPVLQSATAAQYGAAAVDGDVTIGTDQPLIGIAAADSTDTVAAAGYVDVYIPIPGVIYEAKAKSSAAADTQSEIDALCGDNVVLDLTSSTWTVDTAGGAGANNAFLIVGGNPANSTIKFMIRQDATIIGRAQV